MFTRSFPSSPKRRARWTKSLIGRGGICNGVRRTRKPRNESRRTCRIPDSRDRRLRNALGRPLRLFTVKTPMHPPEAHMYPTLWTRCYTWMERHL